MQVTAQALAQLINATVDGDPDVVITAPSKIEEGLPGTVTFLGNPAYEKYLYTTQASAVLVPKDFTPKQPVSCTLLRVDDVYQTVSVLLKTYEQAGAQRTPASVSTLASVADTATLAGNVSVGDFTAVKAGASVGEGTVLHDQVYVGPDARIGKNCILYPGARVMHDCVVGDECIIHPNAVIGGDGFGFSPDPATGRYDKIPQIGNVILHDRVEIGSCTTVDRATMGSTIIHAGVKLDNHIQVAHNVVIGENTVIAAQTGIAGTARIEENCRIGGQVGIGGHRTVGAGTQVQAQTGIISNIKPGATLAGTPSMHYPDFMRSSVLFKKLPALLHKLEERLGKLEAK